MSALKYDADFLILIPFSYSHYSFFESIEFKSIQVMFSLYTSRLQSNVHHVQQIK